MIIKVAAILRLLIIAISALMLAYAYSDEHENMIRIFSKSSSLIYIISGFFLDAFLTIRWLYHPQIHTGHLVLYIFLGGHFYIFYFIDIFNLSNWGALAAAFEYMPLMWLIGLIPFILCGIGRKKLTKTRIEQTFWQTY